MEHGKKSWWMCRAYGCTVRPDGYEDRCAKHTAISEQVKSLALANEVKAEPVVPSPAIPTLRGAEPTQLWEPCDRCGSEPCYATANGNLCGRCDHPRLNTEIENSTEPNEEVTR